jgi:inhibitor of KinA sporulation pathway (predicted exonuclease)
MRDSITDQIVVVDLEATCWKKTPPEGQQSEIIEIGVCLLDMQTLELSHSESILVKPMRSTVSHFCTKLTTLTQAQVDQGLLFAHACRQLQDVYSTQERLWASWGDYDRKMFQAQCEVFNVPYPFGAGHRNIKAIYGERFNGGKKVGLARGLKELGIEPHGTPHRGVDDAWNAAHALAAMVRQQGLTFLAQPEG